MAANYAGATQKPAFSALRTAPTTESFSIRYTTTDDLKALYGVSFAIDGEDKRLDTTFLWSSRTLDIRVGNSDDTGYKGKFSIHSIRLYNRPLTEDEIRHNYEIDKARFPLTDMSTVPATLEGASESRQADF